MKVRFTPARTLHGEQLAPGVGLVLEAENTDEDRVVRELADLPKPIEIAEIFRAEIDPKTGEPDQRHEIISSDSIRRVSRDKRQLRIAVSLIFRAPVKPDVIPGKVARGALEKIEEVVESLRRCVVNSRKKKSVKALSRIFEAVESYARDLERDTDVRALRGKEESEEPAF